MEETLFLKDYDNIEYNVGTKWRIIREVESVGDRRIISLSLFFKQSEYPEVTLRNIRLMIEDSP